MTKFLFLLLSISLLAACTNTKPTTDEPQQTTSVKGAKKKAPEQAEPVLTQSYEKVGRIAMVNQGARFVVLSFPIGEVATPEQRLNVYRQGSKVGELRVTGPQRENNTVADIVAGTPQVNDEVREN